MVSTAITGGAVITGNVRETRERERERDDARGRVLIRGGRILTMSDEIGDLETGDLLVVDGEIVAIAHSIQPRRYDEIIDASGMIVIPGYVNAHQHLWESLVRGLSSNADGQEHRALVLDPLPIRLTPRAVYVGTLLGALECLSSGTTTIQNWDLGSLTLDHAKAAVDALADSGVRALHSFSTAQPNQNDPTSPPSESDFRRLVTYMDEYPLVSPHMGARNPTNRPPEIVELVRRSFVVARELGLTISLHAGLPTSRATPALLLSENLLGPDVLLVNGSAFTDAEMAIVASHGAWIITAPENEAQLGAPTPLRTMLSAGIAPVVTPDSIAYSPADLPAQLRVLLQLAREKNVRTDDDEMLTFADVFRYGNVNPARALGLGNRVGSLAVGRPADIALVDTRDVNTWGTTDPYTQLVQMTHPGNVHTVMVAGKIVKRHGQLTQHNLPRLRQEARRIQSRLLG